MQKSLFPLEPRTPEVKTSKVERTALNKAQYEAATCGDGPVLVIAGAGTGKTRTLVYRMAHLLEKGVAPENILLLTFTRKSAQEMLSRAAVLVDESCQRVMGGTFHSIANLLLRRYGRHLGYPANFTILDRSDSEGIVNILKSSLELGGVGKRFPSKRMIINLIGKAVNKSVDLSLLLEEEYQHLVEYLDDIEKIRDHYIKFKFEHGLMDYDDLLVNLRDLLARHQEVRDEVADRFAYILVDEYQDTNPVQAEIVKLMAAPRNNVMVVGDDSQSIYSFRGADFRNIMEFPTIFPGARRITLEENYRSSQQILSLTNAVISNAAEKYSKSLFSNIVGSAKPVLFGARDEKEQARYVVDRIDELHAQGMPYSEIAVLFRSGYHSYKLELELGSHHIDFEKRGGLKLTESAHIKDMVSYLRLVTNPQDSLSWNRVLLLLDKVGPKTADSMLEVVKAADDPIGALGKYPAGKSWKAGLADLVKVLADLTNPGLTPARQFDLVMEYYRPVFERIYHDDYPRRSRDLEQLQTIIAGYDNLQAFLDDASLDPPETEMNKEPGSREKLVLSTIHSAKGLEWDAVFIIHLAEGKFPSTQAFLPEEREEERRLLYVAATRARKNLYLVYPREVMGYDRQVSRVGVSSFIEELPPSGLFDAGQAPVAPTKSFGLPPKPPTLLKKPAIADKGSFTSGVSVKHPFFGEGTIERVVGPRTVEVFFPRHGKKVLHLDYANLEHL